MKARLSLLVAVLLFSMPVPAVLALPVAPAAYPRLGSLGPDDSTYRQQQEQLSASYAAIAKGLAGPELVLYVFESGTQLDLFSLAARLNLPYETLATLNGLDRARPVVPGERLLVPSAPGVFVPESPASDLDCLLSCRHPEGGQSLVVRTSQGAAKYRFYLGDHFSTEERFLFLGRLFRFPLPVAVLASASGGRLKPLAGKMAMRHGVDLAAPYGTEVHAARDGVVTASGVDAILGEYIVITHDGGWQTVYGHLSRRLVRLNDTVVSGMIIGLVGSTGQSTGPYLHFEVRNQGEAEDPEAFIPKVKR
jgi:murein DD-endopeptidase MepM/ murein hydrolase activator NlpD